jgi:Fe-S-cluster-containing dehydrogenase component
LVPHLENLLDVLELERALSNIICRVQRIVNARNVCSHEALIDFRDSCVEIAHTRIRIFSWLSTHNSSTMMNLSIMMKEIKKNVSKVDVLRNPHLVKLSTLDERDNHQKQAIAAQTSLVWIIEPIDSQHLLENQNQWLDEPAV